jgi:hypothetical protein
VAESGVWWVSLTLPGGRTVNKKVTHEELATLIKSGSLGPDTPVSRTEKGPYHAVAAYADLNTLVQARAIKVEADRKTTKYRALYAQIEREDARRRRLRWINNLLGQFTGFVGFLIWLAVIGAIFGGGFFLVRWLMSVLSEG